MAKYDFSRIHNTKFKHIDPICKPIQFENDFPKVLYRYTERPFAEDLIETGKIRLTPLFEYQNVQTFQDGQLDTEEGICSFELKAKRHSSPKKIIPTITYPKWVVCFCSENDTSLMARFNRKNDTLIAINTYPFFETLAKATHSRVSTSELRKVQYLSDSELTFKKLPLSKDGNRVIPCVATVKKSQYSWQKEWRMTFEPKQEYLNIPKNQIVPTRLIGADMGAKFGSDFKLQRMFERKPLEYWFIEEPELRQYCEILN